MTKIKLIHLSYARTFILMASIIILPLFAYASQYHGEDQDTDDKGGHRLGKKNHKNKREGLTVKRIADDIKDNNFVLGPTGHALITKINEELIGKGEARKAFLNDLLSEDTKNELINILFDGDKQIEKSDQESVLYHLLSPYQFYVNIDQKAALTNERIVENKLIDDYFYSGIFNLLPPIKKERNYISFTNINEQDLTETPSHIVISANNMGWNTSQLDHILDQNAEHVLFVKVDNSVMADNMFFLDAYKIPRKTKNLIICDTNHEVNSLYDYFLLDLKDFDVLTSISMEGFTNLTSIGGFFLKGSQLTAFSCEGLENVTSIGSFFLKGNQLTAFSCKGLENVISIEGYFLDNNIHLKSVDLTGLKSIHSICHFFLDGCPNIKEIFVTKEKEALFRRYIPKGLQGKIIVVDVE